MQMDQEFVIRNIETFDFYGDIISKAILEKYNGDSDTIVLPENISGIADGAFHGRKIRSISFSDSYSAILFEEPEWGRHVKELICRGNSSFERVLINQLMICFPNLERLEYPNADKIGLYFHGSLERFPVFCFTGKVKRIYAYGLPLKRTTMTLFVPEISPGYVAEAYRPSLIATFLEHPEWYSAERQKAYREWIRKNASAFFQLCAKLEVEPLIMRCLKMEGMKLTAAAYDELIEFAEHQNDTALKGVLISEKSRYYDIDKLRQKKEAAEMKDLEDPLRVHAMRKMWSWSTFESGELCITKMKPQKDEAEESMVYVPERIAGHTVTGVSGQVFGDNVIRELCFPETVETLRGNMCCRLRHLEKVIIEGRVRSIPYFCFSDCADLKTVSLPGVGIQIGSLEEADRIPELPAWGYRLNISMGAFQNCIKLSALNLSDVLLGPSAFEGAGLKSVVLHGTPVVSNGCFERCIFLATAELLDTVDIEEKAFKDCIRLTDVHVSGALRFVRTTAFAGCKSLKTIHVHNAESIAFAESLFSELKASLPELQIVAENVPAEPGKGRGKEMDRSHMDRRNMLEDTSVDWVSEDNGTIHVRKRTRLSRDFVDDETICIPDRIAGNPVRVIDRDAFTRSCTKTIELPESVQYIGETALRNVSELECVTIAGQIHCIPMKCFEENKTLSYVELTAYHSRIGCAYPGAKDMPDVPQMPVKDNLVICKRAFNGCMEIRDIVLRNVLMQDSAFYSTGVMRLEMHNSPIVPVRCFHHCLYLKEAYLLDVSEIQYEAFSGCISLTDIHLSDTIEYINNSAFIGCDRLARVHLHGIRNPELAKRLFDGPKRFGLGNIEFVIHAS